MCIFKNYFCEFENYKDIIDFNGLEIKLSSKAKGLLNLLRKNVDKKEKFNDAIKNLYFSGYDYKLNKNLSSSNRFFIPQKK